MLQINPRPPPDTSGSIRVYIGWRNTYGLSLPVLSGGGNEEKEKGEEMTEIESNMYDEIKMLREKVSQLKAQLTTPRQFRAKIYGWDEMEDKEDYPVDNEDGWVTGWYADGIMLGKALQSDEDGVIFEWWTGVEESSVEPI